MKNLHFSDILSGHSIKMTNPAAVLAEISNDPEFAFWRQQEIPPDCRDRSFGHGAQTNYRVNVLVDSSYD